MVDRNLIRSLEDDDISQQVLEMFPDDDIDIEELFPGGDEAALDYEINKIIEGKIIRVDDDIVLVDVGYKSEGTLSRIGVERFRGPPKWAKRSRS